MKDKNKTNLILEEPLKLGWREWIKLPELGVDRIKAKVDTGARTCALHTFFLETYHKRSEMFVHFAVHPLQTSLKHIVECDAKVIDRRFVTDSGGHREKRYVILTTIQIGQSMWPIEMTLTNRDSMKFRMLLGRTALSQRCVIYPGHSYLLGKPKKCR